MKVGTKSLLIGVHQVIWHPLTVYRAWSRLYGRPNFRETLCILLHDWGYWGSSEMDGPSGAKHPERGAMIAAALFGDAHRDLVLLHSRRYALDIKRNPSKLCWADKLSIVYEPDWFYLFRARASGELTEYRKQAASWVPAGSPDREWLFWVKQRFAKAALSEVRPRRIKAAKPRACNCAPEKIGANGSSLKISDLRETRSEASGTRELLRAISD